MKNLQLCRTGGLKYIKKVPDIRYEMKNYNNRAKGKVEDINCAKIRKHLIVGLEEYSIQQNCSSKLITFSLILNVFFSKLSNFKSFD